ncbi:MAG: hypothetical protein HN368_06620 [Spirochaetales bacterium]|nr:hypothetical protein [Spirochaetales bacterium]
MKNIFVVLLVMLAVVGCALTSSPGPFQPFWVGIEEDPDGTVVASNSGNRTVAIFNDSISEENIVGVLGPLEPKYRLRYSEGLHVLQVVRLQDLEENAENLESCEIIYSTLAYYDDREQYITVSASSDGEARLRVFNNTDYWVKGMQDNPSGNELFVHGPREERVLHLPSGSIKIVPVAIVPVHSGSKIVALEELKLQQAANQFELTTEATLRYTIEVEIEPTHVKGYLKVTNNRPKGAVVQVGAREIASTVGHRVINPGSSEIYALDGGIEEAQLYSTISVDLVEESVSLPPVSIFNGEQVSVVLNQDGSVEIGTDPVSGEASTGDNIASQAHIGYSSISQASYRGYTPDAQHTVDGVIKASGNHWSVRNLPACISYKYDNPQTIGRIDIYSGHEGIGSLKFGVEYLDSSGTWETAYQPEWINEGAPEVSLFRAEDDQKVFQYSLDADLVTSGIRIVITDSTYPDTHLWRTVISEVQIIR